MVKEYRNLREKMVRAQLASRGIKDKDILQAFLEVPREEFVPKARRYSSYYDCPLPIGFGQTISQPYIVALMTSVLNPLKNEKILEIGCGSGYQTAILSYLGAQVYSIERVPELANRAKEAFTRLGYSVQIKVADGTLGWKEYAPFSGIMVTAAAFEVPPPFFEQLEIGGRIIIPLGGLLSQILTKIVKLGENKFKREEICGCVFVPLVGKYGFKK